VQHSHYSLKVSTGVPQRRGLERCVIGLWF